MSGSNLCEYFTFETNVHFTRNTSMATSYRIFGFICDIAQKGSDSTYDNGQYLQVFQVFQNSRHCSPILRWGYFWWYVRTKFFHMFESDNISSLKYRCDALNSNIFLNGSTSGAIAPLYLMLPTVPLFSLSSRFGTCPAFVPLFNFPSHI